MQPCWPIVLLTLAGCGEPGSSRGPVGVPQPLVDAEAWVDVPASDDVFADRPATFECPSEARIAEFLNGDPVYEVTTGTCEYLSVDQPALVDIEADDLVDIRIWHFDLVAPEPAEAHVGLAVDGEVVWETSVDIPAPAGLILETQVSGLSAPAGSRVQLHLHNHGVNEWAFFDVARTIPGDEG